MPLRTGKIAARVQGARHFCRHLKRCAATAILAAACGCHDSHGTVQDANRNQPTHPDSSGGPGSVVAAPPLSPPAESAATLDQAFQAARSAINAEAYALDTLPQAARRTPEYARRFDALRRASLHADSLRRARDKLRARLARHATR